MNEKRENVIKTKSFEFALQIVELYKRLQGKKEFVISNQLLRSGTAIGALVRESEHAESKLDFIHKMAIAQKEASETEYWLDLLFKSNYIEDATYKQFASFLVELRKLLASIIISTKKRINH